MKMRDWKMRHKPAGGIENVRLGSIPQDADLENAGIENAAQSCRGWKMQECEKREKKSLM